MNALADHFDEQARRADAAESAITDESGSEATT